MYREYCYDKDYNFYRYKNNKLTKITRKEYKEKTGESDYIINKLRNSRWPVQQNDYFFLKVGKFYWPIDWKLFKLIKFFRDNNISSSSSEQGSYKGMISFNRLEDIKVIEKLFGKENIKIFPKRIIEIDPENINMYDEKVEEKQQKEANKYHDKIRIYPEELLYEDGSRPYNRFFISFNQPMIEWMHNKLGLEFPNHTSARKGRRIVHPGRVEKLLNRD